MNARPFALVMVVVLLSSLSVLGQSRGPRGPAPTRNTPRATPEVPVDVPVEPPASVSPVPSPPPSNGAGTVIPPNQGYVPEPNRAPPGSVSDALVPEDPVDQTYWPLYDRERPITLKGKVTRVDWTTPNSYIFLSTDSGMWAVESSFAQFRHARVTPAIRVDEIITIMGYLPRASDVPIRRFANAASYLRANHLIRAGEITTVFGQKLTMGKPPTDEELAKRFTCPHLDC